MSSRRAIIQGASTGINAGAPFTVLHVLAVQQVLPPLAFTQRLAFVLDPEESITAAGVNAGATSFVMGLGVVDAATAVRSLLIGGAIVQNTMANQATDQILLGFNIAPPAASPNTQGLIVIGNGPTFTVTVGHNSFGDSIVIGRGSTLACGLLTDAINDVAIGPSVSITGSKAVAIGPAATVTDDEAVAIGSGATGNTQGIAIGSNSSSGKHGVAVAHLARAADDAIAIGYQANTTGKQYNIAIGENVDATGAADQLILGTQPAAVPVTVANLCVIGGRTPRGYTTFVFGQGYNDAAGGVVFTWRTTDLFTGAGNNLAGNSLVIQAGAGTGNWPNAFGGPTYGIDLQCGIVGAGGNVRQVYTSVLALRHSDLNVAFWGGFNATFGGGVQCIFIKNAVTIPTVAPVGGCLLYVDPATGIVHILTANGINTPIAL